MGAPSIPTINPNKVVQAIIGGEGKLQNQVGALLGQPMFQQASQIGQTIAGMFPGQAGMLQALQGQIPSLTSILGPIQQALGYDTGVLANRGALSASDAASLNAPITAELGQAGMGHTAPGVFEQAMNTWQAQQNRVNTAIGQIGQLVPAMTSAIGQDVSAVGEIPGLIQGLGTGAMGAVLQPFQSATQDIIGLTGAISGPVSSQILANQQAQATSATNAANKQAGIITGALNAVGSAAGAY